MELRRIIYRAEGGIKAQISRRFCSEDQSLRKIIQLAIDASFREYNPDEPIEENEAIRAQDLLVYNFIHDVYSPERKIIRKHYHAYKRLRNKKLSGY